MSKPLNKTDKVVGTATIYATINHEQFKELKGNRDISQDNVNQLVNLMLENGNLTYERPVTVDPEGYIIDGQHRIEACKILGWEVGYIIQEGTIETVRAINRGGHNWNWRDVAKSYAKLGDDNYKWFLEFVDKYQLTYMAALKIAGGKTSRRNHTMGFQSGEFELDEAGRKKAEDTARIITELSSATGVSNSEFLQACIMASSAPVYSQTRMLEKLKELGTEHIPEKASRMDYLRILEATFNHKLSEENKVRLF